MRSRAAPKYLTDLWTERGKRFIEEQKGSSKPFFLYLAYNGPYNLGTLLLEPAKNRHAATYADQDLPSFPRDSMHPGSTQQTLSQQPHQHPPRRRRTSAVDDGVGEILAALKVNGFEENTLVVYASDQGWMGGQNGFFGMGDHTRPTGAHDLMMQVPLIFRQPGAVAVGTSDLLVSNYDFLPSVLDQLGLATAFRRTRTCRGTVSRRS